MYSKILWKSFILIVIYNENKSGLSYWKAIVFQDTLEKIPIFQTFGTKKSKQKYEQRDSTFSSFLSPTLKKKCKSLEVSESNRNRMMTQTKKITYIKVKIIQLNFTVNFRKWTNFSPVHGQVVCRCVCPSTSVYFTLCQSGSVLCLWHSRSTDTASFAMKQIRQEFWDLPVSGLEMWNVFQNSNL